MRIVRFAAVGLVAASVALAVIFSNRFGENPSLVPSPLLGRPAPRLQLPTLAGTETFDSAALEGQVLVVNFFASWCLPCREEQKDLTAVANAFAQRGVTIIGVVYQDTPEAALRFLEETGTSPAAAYVRDPGGRAAIAYGVFGIPETFFVNAEGVVVGKVVGPTDALVLGATIDQVLAGEEPGQQVLGETFDAP